MKLRCTKRHLRDSTATNKKCGGFYAFLQWILDLCYYYINFYIYCKFLRHFLLQFFFLLFFPVMNEKAFLQTYSSCWMCAWRSLSKGSSARSMCTWAPPCWFGNTRGSASPLLRLKPTQNVKKSRGSERSRTGRLTHLQMFLLLKTFLSPEVLILKTSGLGSFRVLQSSVLLLCLYKSHE